MAPRSGRRHEVEAAIGGDRRAESGVQAIDDSGQEHRCAPAIALPVDAPEVAAATCMELSAPMAIDGLVAAVYRTAGGEDEIGPVGGHRRLEVAPVAGERRNLRL